MGKLRLLVAGLCCAAAVLTGDQAAASGTEGVNTVLYQGQRLYANDCSNYLTMQTDGNFVLYRGYSTPVWDTETNRAGYYAIYKTDGELVVNNQNNATVWGTTYHPWNGNLPDGYGFVMKVQEDGNFVNYICNLMGDCSPYWDTKTNGLAPHPSSCQSNYTKLYPGKSMSGNAFAVYSNVSTQHTCGTYCAQNSSCKAWTYSTIGGTCYLKGAVGTLSSSFFSTSGEIAH